MQVMEVEQEVQCGRFGRYFMSPANISLLYRPIGVKRDFVPVDHKQQSKKKNRKTERMASGTGLLLYCWVGI
jgi:hypothetical protein